VPMDIVEPAALLCQSSGFPAKNSMWEVVKRCSNYIVRQYEILRDDEVLLHSRGA
jgi:hypothetical protein